MRLLRRSFLALALVVPASFDMAQAHAGTVNAAVAANFTQVATELAAKFKAKTGNDVKLSFGSTGGRYTQITPAAPFDVFLSPDDKRTKTAIRDGFGVDGLPGVAAPAVAGTSPSAAPTRRAGSATGAIAAQRRFTRDPLVCRPSAPAASPAASLEVSGSLRAASMPRMSGCSWSERASSGAGQGWRIPAARNGGVRAGLHPSVREETP